jgi:hypothetical protein
MTRKIAILNGLFLVLLSLGQVAFAQTESPATIPSSLAGTYQLSYSQVNGGGPFVDGTSVTLVINSNGTLCVNDLVLTGPVLINGNPAEATWKDTASGINYAVSNLTSGFNEVNVGANGGTFFGQLGGSKTSNSTSCDSSPVTVSSEIDSVFSLAESKVPEYFPGGAITLAFQEYVYRFYPATGIYLAMANNNVFLLGGAFGDAIVDAGSISSVISQLEAIQVDTTPGSGGSNPQLWDLLISGTVTTSTFGIGNTINFQGLAANDVPAPDLSNTEEINQEIISSLEGIATGISNIVITVVNNSDSRRTYNLSFSAQAIAAGVSISYQLTYDYTR